MPAFLWLTPVILFLFAFRVARTGVGLDFLFIMLVGRVRLQYSGCRLLPLRHGIAS